MGNFLNVELLSEPINWVVVFLILYFLAILSQYVITDLNAAGVTFL